VRPEKTAGARTQFARADMSNEHNTHLLGTRPRAVRPHPARAHAPGVWSRPVIVCSDLLVAGTTCAQNDDAVPCSTLCEHTRDGCLHCLLRALTCLATQLHCQPYARGTSRACGLRASHGQPTFALRSSQADARHTVHIPSKTCDWRPRTTALRLNQSLPTRPRPCSDAASSSLLRRTSPRAP
jgi:hypothetical protein